MGAQTVERLSTKYPLGMLIAEGKTKTIHQVKGDDRLVVLTSKDDITAGDGAKHDVIPDKGRLANETTCNVFRLLQACGVPVAFKQQVSANSFTAPKCLMLPYEVVVRREAHGSYLKRNPHIEKGHLFPKLLIEFFLKTKDRRWKAHELVCDDPLMFYAEGAGEIALYNPTEPIHGQKPFLTLPEMQVFGYQEEWKIFPEMRRIASQAFLVLEKAWQLAGRRLVDFKVELGIDSKGRLLLTDVIDNDSWRVVEDGIYIDKQAYRDGGALDDVAAKYRHVADITALFKLPRQRIILWRGSESDNVEEMVDLLSPHFPNENIPVIICSVHKEPVAAASILYRLVQEVPDSVVIAYIGRSNGAGPVLSALSTIPVITVPASVKNFPDDVWSSLHVPSNVPVMTVLEPANAALAALQILSARNPRIYAHLRGKVEELAVNIIHT
ncbi:hypothetical protein A2673_00795 [Candidatus Kaiserbacteria bacterium RIFCSPHIGHO2_01_FULL_50_13]|uniref:phosphoribosylaminoimidazolesuccinocarboxamide synthase n=1 Tax=Candidatus Kaiserbacteria bacterium RIFCSPLOWO2_01_FULL_50_24 TaxID=1798507 RepID=A0A1F6EMV0_9BACT|nr:MAG: hypothetical protein A2673_00795 [Candidatus Kaiserbacteria bacterium RIFCSPHIGHO2_01_FULL_50_13]OGG74983.1 MAG: hypothetical protein A3A34_04170 [Candidatus Kaiserbacteria bacterium RIFCSPLOWO2_01_FULL_50_24]OGG81786.1 MAG: hypothetical protein A3H74_01245 [Candidatus Kaiserbacteria bacterium RIFCSPLOWO2_02_FULL_51_13]